MTHKEELLAWFKRGLTITPAEAVDRWNNYRLADTVYQLRQDGHMIHTETMERINADGRRVTWARYSWIGEPMSAQIDPPVTERQGNFLSRLRAKVRGE